MRRYIGMLALAGLMAAAAFYGYVEAPRPETAVNGAGESVEKGPTEPARIPIGSGFDFYVLSLSWSPTYCQSPEGEGNSQQCGASKDFGLIVHGLWPQYENGYPQSCPTDEPDRVPESLGRNYLDIMPSLGLIGHEWREHGSCSGLGQADYLTVTRAAYERIAIPVELQSTSARKTLGVAEIEALFSKANAGLDDMGMAVTCEGKRLDEIRICLTRDLDFRSCPEIDRDGCRVNSVDVPSAR